VRDRHQRASRGRLINTSHLDLDLDLGLGLDLGPALGLDLGLGLDSGLGLWVRGRDQWR